MLYYQIMPFGDKHTYVKIKGYRQKQEIAFFSRSTIEKQENAKIVGYTSLKKKKNVENNTIGTLSFGEDVVAFVHEKKSTLKSVKGYLQVEKNQYVAIERSCVWLWLVLLVLVLLLSILLAFCGRTDDTSNRENPWMPTIDQHIGEPVEETSSAVPQIKIAGFTAWSIPAGQTENLPIKLQNPAGNPCYFSFAIILETGETIYQSDMVPPGENLRKISITSPLEAGTYQAVLHITTNELETGKQMNDAKLNITITAQ